MFRILNISARNCIFSFSPRRFWFLNTEKSGSAEGAAVLMTAKWSVGRQIEEIPGVERAVAVEIVGAAVQIVGAGFSNSVDYAAGAASILGSVVIGEN